MSYAATREIGPSAKSAACLAASIDSSEPSTPTSTLLKIETRTPRGDCRLSVAVVIA